MSVKGSCAPQELLALADGLSQRSSTGQHVSSNQLMLRCKDAEDFEQGEVPFDALLCGLPSDIVGHIFLYADLGDVYNCVGVCSRGLYEGVWQQQGFWMALGGPVFLDSVHTPLELESAIDTVSAFRRWVHCLDGDWVGELERLAQDETPLTLLEEATSRVQGLRPDDVSNRDLWRVVQAVVKAMQRLEPAHPGPQVAASLVERCDRCQDVFNNSQLSSLKTELGNLQERALQQELWSADDLGDEKPLDPWSLDPWSLNLDQYDDSKPLSGAFGGHRGHCLSMGFLAVMDESNLVNAAM
eukprot:gnl/MRDRNA2_/MRDRNA2_29249_c0_seq1.p1 gnl/MRDRNA2_/MRDRNA2_29249_c0~~gnl/MRDRNA2_/MRDRNA2_29249_c0_seq1.p1  ORF type:complete len:342 (+),score=65.43 gnl/MRDRNA2_/MRDRNA2_29249_c0_seq1:131-1027(+)